MSDTYGGSGGDGNAFRGPTRQPYRGPYRVQRETGRREYWVEGDGYVPENDLRRLSPEDARAVRDARLRATELNRSLPDWQRFEELNREEATGSLGQILGNALNAPNIAGREREDEMRAIVNRWTPRQREPGSGTTSDRDIAIYTGAIPGTNRIGPSNSNIIRGIERDAREASEYADFLEWYWPRGGTLAGAQAAWSAYLGQPQRRPWREHFGAGAGASYPGHEPPISAAPRPARNRPQGVPANYVWDEDLRLWVAP